MNCMERDYMQNHVQLQNCMIWVFAFFTKVGVCSCSQVYMAREIETGEIVALKKIRMDNEREGVCFSAWSFMVSIPFENVLVNYVRGL